MHCLLFPTCSWSPKKIITANTMVHNLADFMFVYIVVNSHVFLYALHVPMKVYKYIQT